MTKPIPRIVALALGGLALGFALNALWPSPPACNLGQWRVVVIQSDDWGFEAWFPDDEAAAALAELTQSLPPGLSAYGKSTLETAADVESLLTLLDSVRDLDGLPAVMQANTIVAAIETHEGSAATKGVPLVEAELVPAALRSIRLRPSGRGSGRYARPGLIQAIDRGTRAGLWYPELHGLTHVRLSSLVSARALQDPIEIRAREYGMVAYDGWRDEGELDGVDPLLTAQLTTLAIDLFVARFGRRPGSMIAPDYRWGPDDEVVWARQGIQVVQAKREQVDPAAPPRGWWGRARKWLGRARDRKRGLLTYLDRPARLEPYGDAAPDARQGSQSALTSVHSEWAAGRPAILSTHRVQFVSLDPTVAAAGRAQLRRLLEDLQGHGVRFCLDVEVAQLLRSGVSSVDRGPWRIIRNFNAGYRLVETSQGQWESLAPGTHIRSRE